MNPYLNFSLEGKVALVTGASYGIGFAIASAFAEQGAKICFNDINQELVDRGLASYKEKGIPVHGYVCDVNKVMVYNLADKAAEPRTIALPEGNLFANDLVSEGDYLYVSVTNTDRIFRVDISRPGQPGQPQEWLSVAGPNGLLLHEGSLYVASYPADGRTTDAHVVYRIADLKNPVAEKWMEMPGQYDGLAVASDGKALYVTNWTPAQVSRIDLNTRQLSPLDLKLPQALVGPADITVTGGYLYIPDLPNSRVVVVKE